MLPALKLISPDALPEPRQRYVKMMLHHGVGALTLPLQTSLGTRIESLGLHLDFSRAFHPALERYAVAVAQRLGGKAIKVKPSPVKVDAFTAANGTAACSYLFDLAVQVLDGQHEEAALQQVASRQAPDGSLLHRGPDDQLEPWWYHELVMLHAISSIALHTQHPIALQIMDKAARFHHAETQPDHATSQPLALHAFLQDTDMLPTVDLLLHAAMTHQGKELEPTSKLLLLDAAVCLLREH